MFMTDPDLSAWQPFLNAYERVRSDEQWGGDDLDLPFNPKRHRHIWDIRQRTFRVVQSIAERSPKGLAADVGAGNCWMTRYLDSWGFDAIAVDVNTSENDGLRAGQRFVDSGSRFLRVRSPMQSLPFASSTITLLVTSASFHYADDFRAALCEFTRVLTPGGRIVIADTPVYERESDGQRMVAERVEDFRRKYAMPQALASRARYVTLAELKTAAESLNLNLRVNRVWPGLRRSLEAVRARMAGRRLAEFPVIELLKN
jgi:ubiquinone/menaquinone biosynthesis C-methylase UbiE